LVQIQKDREKNGFFNKKKVFFHPLLKNERKAKKKIFPPQLPFLVQFCDTKHAPLAFKNRGAHFVGQKNEKHEEKNIKKMRKKRSETTTTKEGRKSSTFHIWFKFLNKNTTTKKYIPITRANVIFCCWGLLQNERKVKAKISSLPFLVQFRQNTYNPITTTNKVEVTGGNVFHRKNEEQANFFKKTIKSQKKENTPKRKGILPRSFIKKLIFFLSRL
jgi:hypothetical protein